MVARLLYGDFTKNDSFGFRRKHAAETIDINERKLDPSFRMRVNLRHFENFSKRSSDELAGIWSHNVCRNITMTKAIQEGVSAFWSTWFKGMSDAAIAYSEAMNATAKPSRFLLGRSEDRHVLYVRFQRQFPVWNPVGKH
jgi:hypothetical protein